MNRPVDDTLTPVAPRTRQRRIGRAGGTRSWSPATLRVVLGSLGPSSVLIGAAAAIAMLVRLFVPAVVGMADNGEGLRYICQLGLVPAADVPRYWSFAIFDWVPAPGACDSTPSSGLVLLEAARGITALLGGADGTLNLRVAVAGYALLCGVLIGAFAFTIRRNLGLRVGLSVLLFVILADGAFAGYAGSIYADYAGLVGIALLTIAAVYLGTGGAKQWLGLAFFTMGSALAILSTPRAVVIYLPIAVLLACTTVQLTRRRQAPAAATTTATDTTDPDTTDVVKIPTGRRILRGTINRVVPVAAALLLLVPTVIASHTTPEANAVDRWQFISLNILADSSDPEADLAAMGLPEQLALHAGTSVWEDDTVTRSAEWAPSIPHLTHQAVLGFLLTHPDRALTILNKAAGAWFQTRAEGIGSYDADTGNAPGAHDDSLLEELGTALTTMGILPLLILWGALTWYGIHLLRHSTTASFRRAFTLSALTLIGIAITQFLTVALGESLETPKPLLYSIFSTALAVTILTAGALSPRTAPEPSPDDADHRGVDQGIVSAR